LDDEQKHLPKMANGLTVVQHTPVYLRMNCLVLAFKILETNMMREGCWPQSTEEISFGYGSFILVYAFESTIMMLI
jgi:hypothetical protein